MRIAFAIAALLLLATFAPPQMSRPPADGMARLYLDAIPLNPRDESQRQVGRLVYQKGWQLSSDDFRFGGISALHVEGGELTAISDAGDVFRFPTPGSNTQQVRIFRLPRSREHRPNVDAESLVVEGRKLWVGLETQRSVWRYALPAWSLEHTESPSGMRNWRANRGLEAMLRLPDGRFLLFEEGVSADGTSELLLFDSDPTEKGPPPDRLRYRPPEGYRITDAALLPDGRALFLNRRLGLRHRISAKLTLASLEGLAEGIILEAEEIAHLRRPLNVDNMEALSVTQEQGRTILWIASDDNFTPLQRTLLIKFALAD
jgi:hypothetical protein